MVIVKSNPKCAVSGYWVDAWQGSQQMRDSQAIQQVQIPVDNLLKGSSSWLRVVRDEHAAREKETVQ
jgi:hypothetical protein